MMFNVMYTMIHMHAKHTHHLMFYFPLHKCFNQTKATPTSSSCVFLLPLPQPLHSPFAPFSS